MLFLNLPNKLTVFRMILVPIFVLIAYLPIENYVLGFSVQAYLGDSLFLFDFDEDIYDRMENVATSDSYSSRTSNFNYAIVNILPYFFYALLSLFIIKRFKSNSNLLKFESFVIIYLCYIVLEMNVYITYRLALYYMIYFILLLSESFVEFASLGWNSKYRTKVFL